ncbi:hypothetical protein LTR62_002150 [Meristemomyces frigidus]|uniref:F-box domain-containing protein n=1 Tax=Meristemomyces frigidus TaxID=1508187 RepID=A0AAN7T8S0_9PEZI|nr:hypothetical protein LTR62_002150 [Meristemomyces frigidus]
MVYRASKRTKKETPSAKAKPTTITDLPDEILLHILPFLPISSVLSLRQANSLLEPACTTAISESVRTLYIHPSPKSLLKAIEICGHPVLGKGIMEVVLLGRVLWRSVTKTWPMYRFYTGGSWGSTTAGTRHWLGRFRPWPLQYPVSARRGSSASATAAMHSLSLSQAEPATRNGFHGAYKPLVTALASLPKLRSLRFSEHCNTPGFNQITAHVLQRHAESSAETRAPRKHNNMITARADVEVLLGLFTTPGLLFHHLTITTELLFAPGQPGKSHDRESRFHGQPFITPGAAERLAGLSSLELHFDHGWDCDAAWHHFCRALVTGATQLERLRLVYRPVSSVLSFRSFRGDHSVYAIFGLADHWYEPRQGLLHLARLKSFTLIVDFIHLHASTLETVDFHNVTFGPTDAFPVTPPSIRMVPNAIMKSAIAALQLCEHVRNVKWTVDHVQHHERCELKHNEHFAACDKWMCGRYSLFYGTKSLRQEVVLMEEVAEKWGVGLDSAGKGRDFGIVVWQGPVGGAM